jgi:hypothetical protein
MGSLLKYYNKKKQKTIETYALLATRAVFYYSCVPVQFVLISWHVDMPAVFGHSEWARNG